MFDISAAIDNALSALFGEFSKLTNEKLDAFAESFSLLSGSRVKEAVRKVTWTKETLVCKKKGNQQQLDHYLQVLEKLEKLKARRERIAHEEGQRRNTRTGSVYEGRNSRWGDVIPKAQNLVMGVLPVAQKLGHVLR